MVWCQSAKLWPCPFTSCGNVGQSDAAHPCLASISPAAFPLLVCLLPSSCAPCPPRVPPALLMCLLPSSCPPFHCSAFPLLMSLLKFCSHPSRLSQVCDPFTSTYNASQYYASNSYCQCLPGHTSCPPPGPVLYTLPLHRHQAISVHLFSDKQYQLRRPAPENIAQRHVRAIL